MMKKLVVVLTLAAVSASARGQKGASPEELSQITARGKMLAEYDQAAWHATDAVLAAHPAQESGGAFVCRKTDGRWSCVFGRLNDHHNKFLVANEAVAVDRPSESYVERHDPPQEDTGFFLMAARAVNTATADFQKTAEKRPYNAAVLPADSGQFYVYLVPAQTTNGIYPLGGDARYLVSPDGTKIVEKRQLHSTILEVRSTQPGAKTEGGFHTHILTDVPEDTDVFFVLTRNPPLPEFIGTKRGNYLINRDGLIARIK